MKKFIKKTLIFLSPFLVLLILIEILLRNIPNDYKYKREYLDKNSNKIETLILGSSHSFYGIDPDYFSTKTFNASHVSQSLDFDYEILKKYQNRLNRLKIIILPIDYFSLWGKLEVGVESWRVKNYVIYYGIDKSHQYSDYSEVLSNKLLYSINRLFSYYNQNAKSDISCSKLGWGESYKLKYAQDLIKTGETAAKRHTKDINSIQAIQDYYEEVEVLKKMIEWAERNNVKVILFTSPAFETYYKNLDRAQYGQMLKLVNDFAKKYHNCMYLNLMTDKNFLAKDFYDADHLSEFGAKKLSLILDNKQKEFLKLKKK